MTSEGFHCPLAEMPSGELGVAHAGDLVVLRFKASVSGEGYASARQVLGRVQDETGVRFLLLDENIEVVSAKGGEAEKG